MKRLNKKRGKARTRLLVVLGLVIVSALVWGWLTLLEGHKPSVGVEMASPAIGAFQEVSVTVSDRGSGLRKLQVLVDRDGKETPLFEKEFPSAGFFRMGTTPSATFNVRIETQKLGIPDGKAILRMMVWDYSWRGWWHGNMSSLDKPIAVDTRSPEIDILTQAHNINQGGAGVIIYRVSEKGTENGVAVGKNYFPGHAGYFDDPDIYMAFFALDYRQGKDTEMSVTATDPAGNTTRAGFYYHIRPKKFRNDTIRLSDGFLDRKMPDFDKEEKVKSQPTSFDKFMTVNTRLRNRNSQKILSIGMHTHPDIDWQGTFTRLPSAASRAKFADRRSYVYKGRVIDQQTHLGVDLASLKKAPVPAANSGIITFSGDVGIYGKTIVIDHGFGLFSAYSHLSRMDVHEGDRVKKGDIIGRTGTTGLAGGDHLHYGMFIHNVFVNPIEWWDESWIKNNVTDKINTVKSQLREEKKRQ